MENYRKSAHCTYDIKYHIVWITKYRKPVLAGKIAERTRELIRGTRKQNEVEILAGHVSKHSSSLGSIFLWVRFSGLFFISPLSLYLFTHSFSVDSPILNVVAVFSNVLPPCRYSTALARLLSITLCVYGLLQRLG